MSSDLRSPERATRPAKPRIIILPRPGWLDFFLILVGCALSLVLTDLSAFHAAPTPDSPDWLRPDPEAVLSGKATPQRALLNWLPHLLFLPLGILLFWPVFYLTQRFAGRSQTLAVGEWLWGLTWLGAVVLTVWIVWQAVGSPPEFLAENFKKGAFVGYAVAMLALGVVALLTGVVDLIVRWSRPWTHQCALALLTWPALLLLALLVWRIEMK